MSHVNELVDKLLSDAPKDLILSAKDGNTINTSRFMFTVRVPTLKLPTSGALYLNYSHECVTILANYIVGAKLPDGTPVASKTLFEMVEFSTKYELLQLADWARAQLSSYARNSSNCWDVLHLSNDNVLTDLALKTATAIIRKKCEGGVEPNTICQHGGTMASCNQPAYSCGLTCASHVGKIRPCSTSHCVITILSDPFMDDTTCRHGHSYAQCTKAFDQCPVGHSCKDHFLGRTCPRAHNSCPWYLIKSKKIEVPKVDLKALPGVAELVLNELLK